MSKKNSSSSMTLDEKNLSELREVLLGENYRLVTDRIRHESRDIVKDVLTEALHDRQKKDNSIDKVLLPIVERSVELSVSGQSDKLIGSLYPLVGGLVRKAVKAFLNDFIEKTNQLLENSLTIKGLKWRLKARQSGVSFAQYAASQTFVYRVEHILLIHRETGILLKSIDHNAFGHSNVDLISSMLTAINDFVADSFVQRDENEEQLQTIKTDNFSLLIKPGPYAMIVVAVTGNYPHRLLDKMQLTLENIHKLYEDQLQEFSGDVDTFEEAGSQLRDCLISEEKKIENEQKTKPWLAWCLLCLCCLGVVYALFISWQSHQLKNKIIPLNQEPGYVVKSLDVDWDKTIHLEVFRDPDTLNIQQWLDEKQINTDKLNLTEHLFYSTDRTMVNVRLQSIFEQYPSLEYQWKNNQLLISGELSITQKQIFIDKLIAGTMLSENFFDTSSIHYKYGVDTLLNNNNHKKELFFLALAELNLNQLNFTTGSSQISSNMEVKISNIAKKYKELSQLAKKLNYRLALILVGTSDNKGHEYTNHKLSLARAVNVKFHLVNLGVDPQNLYTSNISSMTLTDIPSNKNVNTRKVLFNVVYVDISNNN